MPIDFRLIDARACDDRCLAQAAALVYSSLPLYYDLFVSFGAPVQDILERSFRVRGTSVESAVLALAANDEVVGVVAGHDLSTLQRTSFADLQLLIGGVETSVRTPVREALRAYSQDVPPISGTGRYLARIAVAPSARGSGLGDLLLTHFEQSGEHFYLHVHRDNERAISFYRRRDYQMALGPETAFRVMSK
jgi:ribosomal protein S18 acetylase RimI-like enzyme